MDFVQRVDMTMKLQTSAKEAHEVLQPVYTDNWVTLKTVNIWYEREMHTFQRKMNYSTLPKTVEV